jgi:hypothetical protein
MTIEQTLESINAGIQQLVAGQQQLIASLNTPQVSHASVPTPPPVPQAPVQAAAPIPPQQPAYAPAPQNPAPPAPALPGNTAAPFVDAKGLMDYAMQKYQQLGPVKGGMIQSILMGMNTPNINMLQPAQYAEFYSKVESIQ